MARKMTPQDKGRKVAADLKHPWRRRNTELFKTRQPSSRKGGKKPERTE